jgi:16S rRNA (cytosine967-C5)-methyltransferase
MQSGPIKIFPEMNVTRIRHLENAISHFERTNQSLDLPSVSIDSHLRAYFRAHRGKLAPVDREWISDKFRDIYRWRGLLSHFCVQDNSSNLLRTYFGNPSWRAYNDSTTMADNTKVSMPEDLFLRMVKHFGKSKTLEIGRIWNEKTPQFMRVNILRENRQNVLRQLSYRGVSAEASKASNIGIKILRGDNIHDIAELGENLLAAQDESCQLIGCHIGVKPGEKILDFCSGSGGKSLVFGPKLQGKGHIFLHDIKPNYLLQARRKLRAVGIRNFTCISPGSEELNKLEGKMDWVLVDPPTTGTGQFRRYPDRKWLFSDSFLHDAVQQQRTILASALNFVSPRGKIVYATSSILPEENEMQIRHFCDTHRLYLVSEPIRSLPVSHGMDGFFCAIMERK